MRWEAHLFTYVLPERRVSGGSSVATGFGDGRRRAHASRPSSRGCGFTGVAPHMA